MRKFTKFISHHPRLVLLIMTMLLIPSIISYKNTGVNYNILSYLPADLKSTQGQNILDKDFKNAATVMVILVKKRNNENRWCRRCYFENINNWRFYSQ